jgi:hypothetical protein
MKTVFLELALLPSDRRGYFLIWATYILLDPTKHDFFPEDGDTASFRNVVFILELNDRSSSEK